MVRIRLRRTGLKNQSSFRIMAADKESPRDGRFLEILGYYNPRHNPSTVEIKEDRVYEWMSKGAQPSDSVIMIFNSVGLMDRFARFKAGESVETLLAEAKVAYERHAKGENADGSAVVKKTTVSKKAAKKAAAPKEAAKEEKTEAKVEAPAEDLSATKVEAVVEEAVEVKSVEAPAEAVVEEKPVEVPVEAAVEEKPVEAPTETPAEATAAEEKPVEADADTKA
jgi:small subunit ribosomal protein S16